MSDLKPCPFCGGVAEITRAGSVKCKTSLCYAHDRLYGTPALSIAAWNTRAPTETNARADALQKQLNKLRRLKRKTWTGGIPDEEISRNEGWNALYDKLQKALEQTP